MWEHLVLHLSSQSKVLPLLSFCFPLCKMGQQQNWPAWVCQRSHFPRALALRWPQRLGFPLTYCPFSGGCGRLDFLPLRLTWPRWTLLFLP